MYTRLNIGPFPVNGTLYWLITCFVCVPHHAAMIRVVEALQQLNAGALPAAAAAHEGQGLAGLHRNIQAVQNLDVRPGGVGELAVDELDVPLEVVLKTSGGGGS